MTCECCGSTAPDVHLHPSHTSYALEPMTRYDWLLYEDREDRPDPNADILMCNDCAETHDEFWAEQWAGYYQGLL